MVDAASNAAAPRVVLLARAGKAADHLAEAVRQAGAELLATVDPATADEAALRALGPQAVLVALEPSIEPMLDKLEGLLSDSTLTVIYDEAEVAAHRAGWDAARWARHLSAKLRHDSNVLPPGTESDHEWQPSPGQIPKPAAAYADVDMTAFTREAVAHADSVPADGMPVDSLPMDGTRVHGEPVDSAPLGPSPALTSLPPAAAPIDAIPAAPAKAVPPPLPPLPEMPVASGIEAFQTASFETMALESEALEHADSDHVALEHNAFEHASLEHASLEHAALEPVDLDAESLEAFAIDAGAGIESLSLESMSFDSERLDRLPFERAPLENAQSDGIQLDGMQLESMQLESIQLDGMPTEDIAYESVSAAIAPIVTPMQLDEDAFFLEELSATDLPQLDGEPTATLQYGDAFDSALGGDDVSDFRSFDLDSVPSADTPSSGPRDVMSLDAVMSFEDLIASSLAAADTQTTPAASPAPSESGFSIGGLSLAPVDEAPMVVEKSASSPATHDLSALESRISSLSLVDIDDAAADTFGIQATPVVLVEAGLGGPDPARQLLSSIPAEFQAVVLVRLHLQGGRYDRLVSQMERTAALPVALAQSGATANPGTIYFLPDGIGLAARAGGFGFVDDLAPPAAMFKALPSGASALVFLSGSDPQLVDSALAAAATGTLVVAQSPEDCYDGAACAELRNRGIASGLPAELAGRLASRWPS